MDEASVRDFFLGTISARQLANDVVGAIERVDEIQQNVWIRDMDRDCVVTREMLLRLCDAVLAGELDPEMLEPIAFCLEVSDHFVWEDDVITNIVSDWSAPQINYALTRENVEMFQRWLCGIEPCPERAPLNASEPPGRLILRRQKKWL